jgi:hypothetical protein
MKPTARLHKILAKDESYHIGGFRLPSGDFTDSDHKMTDHPIMESSCYSGKETYRRGLAGGFGGCEL